MLPRFVITEFFRTPDIATNSIYVWYFKNSDTIKRELIFEKGYFCDKFYNKQGQKHRNNGEPAVIDSQGHMQFAINGKLHRGHFEPAVIYPSGTKEYWVYGEKRFETPPSQKKELHEIMFKALYR